MQKICLRLLRRGRLGRQGKNQGWCTKGRKCLRCCAKGENRNTGNETLISSNANISSLDYLEVNKLDDVEVYNDNPRSVSSRVYMSMDCSIDSVFNFYEEFR